MKITRRRFLRNSGVALALPRFARAAEQPPRRMLLISNNLSVLPNLFFPAGGGREYQLSPYLRNLAAFRNDFTVFSGLSHPAVEGGHSTENCFLTGARGPTKSGFRNTISLDQFAAEKLGPVTRFPSLNLGVNIDKANRSLSWTRDGALLPAEDSAPSLFRKMFVQGDPASVQQQLQRLEERGSILDTLLDEAGQLSRSLGTADRTRLDQYLTSVREVESRLQSAREWEQRPKPAAKNPPPDDIQDKKLFFEKFDLMLSMAQLAFESDSTRIVTLMVDGFATPVFKLHPNQDTTDGYHNLSHHGHSPEKLKQLEEADHKQMVLLNRLLEGLAAEQEGGQRLLDRTMVLYGSNLGDANTHNNTNLPVLLAGGGFKHGQHIVSKSDSPLCNLFVSMLELMGIGGEFGTSTGRLSNLEWA